MADKETEAEWARMRQVEAERQKAAKAVREEDAKQGKVNLAFLAPTGTKTKGWSSNPDVVLADAEKMANRSLILALCGILLIVIGDMGNMVSQAFELGLAGLVLAIPGTVGALCAGVATLIAVIVMGYELYAKLKRGRSIDHAFFTALGAVLALVIYICLKKMIL